MHTLFTASLNMSLSARNGTFTERQQKKNAAIKHNLCENNYTIIKLKRHYHLIGNIIAFNGGNHGNLWESIILTKSAPCLYPEHVIGHIMKGCTFVYSLI